MIIISFPTLKKNSTNAIGCFFSHFINLKIRMSLEFDTEEVELPTYPDVPEYTHVISALMIMIMHDQL